MILAVTATYLGFGLAAFVAWRITGRDAWIDSFFRVPGALLSISLALVELWFGVRVLQQFSPGETLHRAWLLISASALCDVLSSFATQWFSVNLPMNPLTRLDWWSKPGEDSIREIGLIAGGPVRFALLAAGLSYALNAYRKAGFLGRLKAADWLIVGLVCAYVLREFIDLASAVHAGKQPGWEEISNWPVDPLLCALTIEALLLYRSARQMGSGWIGKCWKAFSAGILLITLGDVSLWATAYGYLPYPWSALGWYLWLLAGAAFAVAPVFQLEAIQHASARPGQ